MGAHRVAGEDDWRLAHLSRDHRLQVVDKLRVSITLTPGGRVGLTVTAGVVGDDGVAGALEAARAVDDRARGSP